MRQQLASRLARRLFAVAPLGLIVMGQPHAFAQPSPDGVEVGEVVVTAQRRPQAAQEVPMSLTAAAGKTLELLQATDMASLGKVAPSLVMMRTGAFTQPFLRGVGKRSTLGVENSVATYVDGVYLASSISALLDLRGIERVEVLNGPQGTLFGRNTTGGVIQVVTRDPSARPAAEAEFSLGSYAYARGDAYLSGGGGRLSGNLAVSLSRHDGYGVNLFTGRHDEGRVDHSLVARGKSIWRPAEAMKVTLAADYQDSDHYFAQRPVEGYPAIGAPRVTGFRDGDQDASNHMRFRYGGASVRADADLGGLSLMSLTAARRMRARYGADLDLGPQPLFSATVAADQDQFSQEFQLQSNPAAAIQWLGGLYYIRLDERYDPTNFQLGGSYAAQRGGRIEQHLFDQGLVSSYAAYGQATFPLGDRTRLTAGVRYTIEERSVRANGEQIYDTPPFLRPIAGLPLTAQAPFRNSETFREPTWRVSLDRELSDTVMGYLSASRGFQSGGWNLQTPQSPPFAPEHLNAYEGGVKYASGSGRVSADAGVFYYDYADIQLSAFTPLGSMTVNAASADLYGLDLQLRARPAYGTDLVLGAQVLDARFNRFSNATCTNFSPGAAVSYAPVSCDATGNRLPFAPRLKFNLGASQEMSLGRRGTVVLSGNIAHSGGYFSEVDNIVRQRAYTTLDASAEWRPGKNAPSVRVWALNLADSRYYDSLTTFPTAGVFQRPAPPRRFGVSIAYVL
jgi:outer membrane receptor protein involved in Fe transport